MVHMNEIALINPERLRRAAVEGVGGGFLDGEGRKDGFDGCGGGVEAEAFIVGGFEEGGALGDAFDVEGAGGGGGGAREGGEFGADEGEVRGRGVEAGEEPEDDVVGVDVHAGGEVSLGDIWGGKGSGVERELWPRADRGR